MTNNKLHNMGKGLVRFAWGVEILAVIIGLLISLMVSVSVYRELSSSVNGFRFADISSIMVAGLPFVLVAVVELCKIPLATAMMFAKHHGWRLAFLIFVLLLSIITFETMLNGFERNFSNLTLSIDEQKDKAKRVDRTIDNLQAKKDEILYFGLDEVEQVYNDKTSQNNEIYSRDLDRQQKFISKQISKLDDSYIAETEDKIAELLLRQEAIYDLWDAERNELQDRIRGLVNRNLSNVNDDKAVLKRELAELKREMDTALADATFLTRDSVERKYRALVKTKEDRLYKVTDYSAGSQAFAQQTDSEQMLQKQLQLAAEKYQTRIKSFDDRIQILRDRMNAQIAEDEAVRLRYRNQYANYAAKARNVRDTENQKAENEKEQKVTEYEEIMVVVKGLDEQMYQLNEDKVDIHYQINRLVNRNQIFRIASYIENEENAIDVEKATVGIVALVWFSSLSFICAVTGVFLAVAGMYLMKVYPEQNDLEEEGKDDIYSQLQREGSETEVEVKEPEAVGRDTA